MSRFDKIIDEKNAEAKEAEDRKTVENSIGILKSEQRKALYMPAIKKYWQEFKTSLGRLKYDTDVTVLTKVLFVTFRKKTKIRSFRDYNAGYDKYGFDIDGNCYEDLYTSSVNYVKYVKAVNDKSVEEVIYDMLPWSQYEYWLKYKMDKFLDDWFIERRAKMSSVLTEMKNNNPDEAVAKYFETLL